MLKAAFLLFFFCSIVVANTWYISPFGSNSNSGTSPTSPLNDLKTALLKAAVGDTIHAASGYYSGPSNTFLTISGINIVGAGSSSTIFQGTTTSRSDYIFRLTDKSNLQGLTVSTAENGLDMSTSSTLSDIGVTNMSVKGIYLGNGVTTVSMEKMSFTDCEVAVGDPSSGSTLKEITVSYSYFSGCDNGIDIGASSATLTNVTISNTDFNGAFDSDFGLAISNVGTTTLTLGVQIANCTFRNYDYYTYGPALTISATKAQAFIVYSTFRNNSCVNGCAMYITGSVDVYVGYSSFANNDAGTSGAALYSSTDGTISVYNSMFQLNVADGQGGAIYLSGSKGNLVAQDSSFVANSGTNGGAIYAGAQEIEIDGCTFTQNTATSNGGALGTSAIATVTNSSFSENTSSNGGALYLSGSATALKPISVSTSNFTENVAAQSGGAVYQQSGTVQLKAVFIESNTAADNGGGIYTAASLNVVGGEISSNKATDGAGFYVDSYPASVNMLLVDFKSNQASGNGGGFECVGNAGVFLNYASFSENTAEKGSAYYCNTCTITSSHVSIDGNNETDCQ